MTGFGQVSAVGAMSIPNNESPETARAFAAEVVDMFRERFPNYYPVGMFIILDYMDLDENKRELYQQCYPPDMPHWMVSGMLGTTLDMVINSIDIDDDEDDWGDCE